MPFLSPNQLIRLIVTSFCLVGSGIASESLTLFSYLTSNKENRKDDRIIMSVYFLNKKLSF